LPESDVTDPLASLALTCMRSTARPSGKLVCTVTRTGSDSRHGRMSGHDTISTLSTVVGAAVGKADGEAAVGSDVGCAVGDDVGASVGAAVLGWIVGAVVCGRVGEWVGMSRSLVTSTVLLAHPLGDALLSNT
jgi:hypothetical protein